METSQEGDHVVVTVEGNYKEFSGNYTLTASANGELTVRYQFNAVQDVNPRQWKLVFDAPESYDKNFWRRKGMIS